MSIRWKCPQCACSLSIAERKAGQQARCPACGIDLIVPEAANSGTGPASPLANANSTSPPRPGAGLRVLVLSGFLIFMAAGVGLAWMVFHDARNIAGDGIAEKPPDTPASPPTDTPIDAGPATETTRSPLIPNRDPTGPTGPHSLRLEAHGTVIVATDRLNGTEVWRQSARESIVFLAFSGDGETVVSRDQKGETCTWDAATGKLETRHEEAGPSAADATSAKANDTNTTAEHEMGPEELRASLLKIKELDFYPVADKLREQIIDAGLTGTDFKTDQETRQRFSATAPPRFLAEVNGLLLKKAAEAGLPLVPEQYARLPLSAARTMDAMSKELRQRGFISVPGAPVQASTPQTSAHEQVLKEWCKDNHIERYSGALNTFLQMLQVEDDPTRMVLVDELAKVDSPIGIRMLAQRAVFDLAPEVRRASLELLRKHKPESYRAVLLNTLRYPWAPAADHAAAALGTLQDKGAIPQLIALLDKPDPCLPVFDTQRNCGVTQEVVRINHMRNCFLCHAASQNQNDLVRGAVPRAGQPLPQLYYNYARADFVQADVTFLRQDFSVPQTVENAAPWPTMQRYDYMVRLRKASDAEMARLHDAPVANYPQRNAVLAALRQLSGRDLGNSTKAWKKYLTEKTPAKQSPDD